MSSNALKIFSGTESVKFSESICRNLNIKIGDVYRHVFPSGEKYCQFKENIRGGDVFLVSCRGQTTDDSVMELLIMADAARRASADRITAVIPFFYYSRQDRKERSRVPVSAKLVLDLYAAAGINRILTMDLHSPQIGGFTNLPFDHLLFEPILIEYIRNKFSSVGISIQTQVVVMAPDVGAVKRIEQYASLLKCDFGFISKKRLGDDKVQLQSIIGDVNKKKVIIIDDLTESCGTLIQAGEACKNNGATHVMSVVTHGCITETGVTRLEAALNNKVIDEFVYSNSTHIAARAKLQGRITELDVSGAFARAIHNIHNNESVSELFV